MDKSMTTSGITDGQINRACEIFRAQLTKHRSELPSDAVQQAFGDSNLPKEWLASLRTRVEDFLCATEPHILKRQCVNLGTLLSGGWEIAERVSMRTGSNLDAGKITTKDYLGENESGINGEEILRRIKAAGEGDIQLDEQDFLALYQEKDHATLKWLYKIRGITRLSFWGTILLSPQSDRAVLCLCRNNDGSWSRGFGLIEGGYWRANYPAGVQ